MNIKKLKLYVSDSEEVYSNSLIGHVFSLLIYIKIRAINKSLLDLYSLHVLKWWAFGLLIILSRQRKKPLTTTFFFLV